MDTIDFLTKGVGLILLIGSAISGLVSSIILISRNFSSDAGKERDADLSSKFLKLAKDTAEFRDVMDEKNVKFMSDLTSRIESLQKELSLLKDKIIVLQSDNIRLEQEKTLLEKRVQTLENILRSNNIPIPSEQDDIIME